MGEGLVAHVGRVFESFITECGQFCRADQLVVSYVSYHCSTARLGPHGLHLETAVSLSHIEQGVDDSHLLADSLPVEQMLVFFGREVYQDSVVHLHAVYEHLCQPVFPKLIDRFVIGGI